MNDVPHTAGHILRRPWCDECRELDAEQMEVA